MTADCKILVFISGRGSNLECIIQQAENYRVIGVVSNKADAAGLALADKYNVAPYPFSRSNYESLGAFKAAIFELAQKLAPDFIALAGFMQIIEPEFVAAFSSRLLNIHPALLPKFPGIDTHQRAITAQEKYHGCTVHYVDAGVDTGPIIAQAAVAVLAQDSPESLAERVLRREHRLYPWVLNGLARGEIFLTDKNVVVFSAALRRSAAEQGFVLPPEGVIAKEHGNEG